MVEIVTREQLLLNYRYALRMSRRQIVSMLSWTASYQELSDEIDRYKIQIERLK